MNKVLIAFVATILTSSCTTVRLSTNPSKGISQKAPLAKESMIFIPIEVDLKSAEELVEKNVPKGQIYYKNVGCEREEYKVRVYRNNPIKVSSKNNKLIFQTNLNIKANGKYCAGVWTDNSFCRCCCVGAHPSGSANSVISLKIEIDLNINSDYQITAKTNVDGKIISGTHARINLLGFVIKIPVEDIVGPIRNQLKPIASQLDTEIAHQLNSVNLKTQVSKAWNDAYQNIKIDSLFWFNVQPKNVYFQNITSADDKIKLGIGLGTIMKISTVKDIVSPVPLPKLIVTENRQGVFNFKIPADASFKNISKELSAKYTGQRINRGRSWVKPKEISMYSVYLNDSTPGILLEMDIKGKVSRFRKVKGLIYFTTKPAIDTAKKIIYMDDFKLNANTNAELINKGLEFLVNDFYYENISKSALYNYEKDLSTLETDLQKQLSNILIDDYILNLLLDKIEINGIYITDKVIGIDTEAKGTVQTILAQ